jgi:TonB family protein
LDEQLELLIPEKRGAGGIALAIVLSFVLHGGLIYWVLTNYQPAAAVKETPIARYVELMKQNPREFVEAPGPKLEQAPRPDAPLSDANRKASTPRPTGDQPTPRPGDGSGLYTPPSNPAPRGPRPQQATPDIDVPAQAAQNGPRSQQPSSSVNPQEPDPDRLAYREQTTTEVNKASAGAVDWRSAIREVGKVASLGGGDDDALRNIGGGGEKGTAEQGPLSFETQWYDWGDYAQSMVSKIRVHWYANMPQIIRTGMKGVVTIRFTIQRDGRITNIEMLESSTVPPYDQAARKAIELASPLRALPKDFPNPSERVTAMFYYNKEVPTR